MITLKQFEDPIRPNSAHGNSARKAMSGNASDGIELTNTDKFAREIIQNSCDASIEDFTQMRIESLELNSEVKENIFKVLGIEEFLKPRIKETLTEFPNYEELNNVLLVEDKSTWGLTEDDTNSFTKSRFWKFFFDTGGNEESNDLGGSYGYGKAVYTDNSSIRTIIVYSCSKNNDGNYSTKLMGITKTASYEFDSKPYTGFIYHSKEYLDDIYHPIRDQEADELAIKLGFKKRECNEIGSGTSIAIIGLKDNPDEFITNLKKSIEMYWWKKLVEKELFVEFIYSNKTISYADPETNNFLLPYIDSYEILKKRRSNSSIGNKIYNKTLNKKLGNINFNPGQLVLQEISPGTEQEFDVNSPLINSIALFRKSGMVIKYLKPVLINNDTFITGVFEADDKLNKLLRSSEPANHWGWNPNSPRIEDLKEYLQLGLSLDGARNFITKLEANISQQYRNFQSTLIPEVKNTSSSFRSVDKLLTKIFGKGNSSGQKGGGNKRDIRIHHINTKKIEKTNPPEYECELKVFLDSDCEKESSKVAINHKLKIMGDDNAQTIIEFHLSKLLKTDAKIIHEEKGQTFFEIKKEPAIFLFRSYPFSDKFHREFQTDYVELEES